VHIFTEVLLHPSLLAFAEALPKIGELRGAFLILTVGTFLVAWAWGFYRLGQMELTKYLLDQERDQEERMWEADVKKILDENRNPTNET